MPNKEFTYSVGDRVVYLHPEAGNGTRMPRGSLATVIEVQSRKTVVLDFDDAIESYHHKWLCDVDYIEPCLPDNIDLSALL